MRRPAIATFLGIILLLASAVALLALHHRWVSPWTSGEAIVSGDGVERRIELDSSVTKMIAVVADGTSKVSWGPTRRRSLQVAPWHCWAVRC